MPLSRFESEVFRQALYRPDAFRNLIRPRLYKKYKKDPEAVHEAVLQLLDEPKVIKLIEKNQDLFKVPDELKITVNEHRIVPFGTSAGFDKNGDALIALSHMFGFQEPGTVVINPRPGNDRPRVAVDEKNEDIYNAQGFPSKGLGYFLDRIRHFRQLRGEEPIVYVSICGLPLSEQNAILIAMEEMKRLIIGVRNYVQGIFWNPYSPHTAALAILRNRETFKQTAELMRDLAPDKLRLVKMGPYEDNDVERKQFLDLAAAFLDGGGHGIIAVNTKPFPKEQIPVPNWGYHQGGRSGRFLRPYRLRVVEDARKAFPDSVIIATGGIYDGDDAFETFARGATMLAGYTPYTYYGFGLFPKIEKKVFERLQRNGYRKLWELQDDVKKGRNILLA